MMKNPLPVCRSLARDLTTAETVGSGKVALETASSGKSSPSEPDQPVCYGQGCWGMVELACPSAGAERTLEVGASGLYLADVVVGEGEVEGLVVGFEVVATPRKSRDNVLGKAGGRGTPGPGDAMIGQRCLQTSGQ